MSKWKGTEWRGLSLIIMLTPRVSACRYAYLGGRTRAEHRPRLGVSPSRANEKHVKRMALRSDLSVSHSVFPGAGNR
ncbi:hypothetical protein CC85DRAFT_282685 [Cutaneotrichosporon oleaginosum]|uniref:Secreted protein n=1 Tax=Cutaneotrichosporon oleaginosum TaxID=879819 RepID=A0A0J0XVT3_9TREE|nr:uncharacterized protein CC85DRAFT_282685 [Cutaneotrichosporon oleaginosum]KLT45192.1 hypothetical protein CC85DRAFT_282685 [Cutaneotrichosporon oleaginosum]TXT14972.1 hypothetical protein COLE_01165 [Cutaneotrichosporon oleaginosum]